MLFRFVDLKLNFVKKKQWFNQFMFCFVLFLGHTLHTQRPTFNNPKPNAGWYNSINTLSSNSIDIEAIKKQEEALLRQALYVSFLCYDC
jgi:hypothetical protein